MRLPSNLNVCTMAYACPESHTNTDTHLYAYISHAFTHIYTLYIHIHAQMDFLLKDFNWVHVMLESKSEDTTTAFRWLL